METPVDIIPCIKSGLKSQDFDFFVFSRFLFSVIGIDEGQFFPDVVEFAEQLANRGKTVAIAALDATYQRKKFNRILELVPLAEYVVKLNAVCMVCGLDAAFTKRIKADDRVEVIGGTELYMATCRECFYKKGTKFLPLQSFPSNSRLGPKNSRIGRKNSV